MNTPTKIVDIISPLTMGVKSQMLFSAVSKEEETKISAPSDIMTPPMRSSCTKW